MPRTTRKVCNVTGCPTITNGTPRCQPHTKAADQARGTPTQRGYGHAHRTRFREQVLARDPYCTVRRPGCTSTSTVADHHPLSRRELVAQGDDPNDPKHGRGCCHRCHSIATAANQPGGWHNR